MDTINVNLNNLTDRERDKLLALVEKANGSEEFPACGEKYFVILPYGKVVDTINDNSDRDREIIDLGNCFRASEEAKFEVERLKVLRKMREIAGDVNMNKETLCNSHTYYTLEYGSDDKINPVAMKCYVNTGSVFVASEVVFPDITDAEKAIREIGKEMLKKYYFRIVE
mgnify:CR=1 FL=1